MASLSGMVIGSTGPSDTDLGSYRSSKASGTSGSHRRRGSSTTMNEQQFLKQRHEQQQQNPSEELEQLLTKQYKDNKKMARQVLKLKEKLELQQKSHRTKMDKALRLLNEAKAHIDLINQRRKKAEKKESKTKKKASKLEENLEKTRDELSAAQLELSRHIETASSTSGLLSDATSLHHRSASADSSAVGATDGSTKGPFRGIGSLSRHLSMSPSVLGQFDDASGVTEVSEQILRAETRANHTHQLFMDFKAKTEDMERKLMAELLELRDLVSSYEEQMESMHQEHTVEVDELLNELNHAKETVVKQQSQIDRLKDDIKLSDAVVQEKNEQISRLQNDSSSNGNVVLIDGKKGQESTPVRDEKKSGEVEELKAKLKQRTTELQDALGRVTELEADNKTLHQLRGSLQDDCIASMEKIATLSKVWEDHEQLEVKKERLEQDIAELEKEREHTVQKAAKLSMELAETKANKDLVYDLEDALAENQRTIRSLRSQLEACSAIDDLPELESSLKSIMTEKLDDSADDDEDDGKGFDGKSRERSSGDISASHDGDPVGINTDTDDKSTDSEMDPQTIRRLLKKIAVLEKQKEDIAEQRRSSSLFFSRSEPLI